MKLDALFFILGTILGIAVFAETESLFTFFWHDAGFLGRFTIPEWLGASTGAVVLGVIVMALGAFAFAEWAERRFRRDDSAPVPKGARWSNKVAAAVLFAGAVLVVIVGQPTVEDRVEQQRATLDLRLTKREVQIDPGELLGLMHNNLVHVAVLDTRAEADFNLFHIVDARQIDPKPNRDSWAHELPAEAVKVVVAQTEEEAASTWRRLVASGVLNVYLLEGGIKSWTDAYADGPFEAALGARHPASNPNWLSAPKREFEKKVKVASAAASAGGGCG